MISVLLPVYNTEAIFLQECLNSIISQTFQNFEIVLIDNDSTHSDTLELIKNYESSKLKIFHCAKQIGKKNLSVALNYGLKHCAYEYVARMDSDDIMLPERLEKQINYMQNNDVDILGTQLKNMYGDQHETSHPSYIFPNYYKYSTFFICHPTVMFKKSKILEIGGYQETPDHIPEDYLLWAKALKNGLKIHNLKEILVRYRNKGYGLSDIDSVKPEWNEAIRKVILE